MQKYTEAAILIEQRKPLVVDKIELPQELKFGQVLVELKASGICGSQLGEIDGVKGEDKFLPHLLGHEGFGQVKEIGAGVKFIKKDDMVVLHWKPGKGLQSEPPKYKWRGKVVNAGWVTTFNKHAIISENRCTKITGDINPDIAALFGCAVTTAFGTIENNAKLKIGESIVVFGAGGIGLNIVQAASMRSAFPIIAIDRFDNRLNLAKELGATHTINSSKEDPKPSIEKCLNGGELDVYIDNTGVPEIIELGYKLVHSKGKVILVGVPKKGSNVLIHTLPLHFGKFIQGTHGGECQPHIDIPRYINLLKEKKLNLDKLISKHFHLKDINNAIESMRLGETAGRIIIKL